MKIEKKFSAGMLTHIYNRGNNKEKIFFDEQDYRAFLFRLGLALGLAPKELVDEPVLSMPYSRIRINSKKNLFKLHAFCLMPNHFHLIIEQCGDESISKLMSKLCISYSMYINKKYKRVGHVLQDRFKFNLIESNEQLMWTSAYVHMNPVKDRIVKYPEKYTWSSYKEYIGTRNIPFLVKEFIIDLFGGLKEFKKETENYFQKDMSSRVLDI